jgi:hypothetical protein
MFRFFRHARQVALSDGSTMRFLRYSFGEILLVVIGILIALQINNWNEERIEQKEIREYALNLSAAIDRDMEMLLPVEMQIKASIRQAEELAKYLRDRSVDEMNNAELFFLTTHFGYRPYAWNRAALEQLKTSGGLRQMRNERLVQGISDYDALTQHLDQDYREDEESARAIWSLVSQLIDLNYDPNGLEDVVIWNEDFTSTDIERRLTQFRELDVFKSLAGMEWPLLSQDLAEFRYLANINRDFADLVRSRIDNELPRLRQFAEEIQTLIDEEYR